MGEKILKISYEDFDILNEILVEKGQDLNKYVLVPKSNGGDNVGENRRSFSDRKKSFGGGDRRFSGGRSGGGRGGFGGRDGDRRRDRGSRGGDRDRGSSRGGERRGGRFGGDRGGERTGGDFKKSGKSIRTKITTEADFVKPKPKTIETIDNI